MLKFWSVFAALVLYDAYVDWIFRWVPGYSFVKVCGVTVAFLLPESLDVTDVIFAAVLPLADIAHLAASRGIFAAVLFLARLADDDLVVATPPPRTPPQNRDDDDDAEETSRRHHHLISWTPPPTQRDSPSRRDSDSLDDMDLDDDDDDDDDDDEDDNDRVD
ncbi:hypothetical protein CTAYLR_008832 [Chrysophaeum taylorii]|uniref:Uncharacterized protein n=1 Tax=Chrysophaeum taylorii TaxID=2483200 RepID=A0AAD7UAC9_9STRA|nr:hypothetical protein CTAYLR_008832 [Chrysophaeum taylorii]